MHVCSLLQCVAVCCSLLQCVAVCCSTCSVLHCAATCCSCVYDMHIFRIVRIYRVTRDLSTENDTLSKSTKSRISDFPVQIQMKPKSQFEFIPPDTEQSEILDLVDFGDAVCPVESVVYIRMGA